MIFRQIDEIVNGTKTQTRRVCKTNESLAGGPFEFDGRHLVSPLAVYTGTIPHERLKWQVGRDYAIVPKRGKPGVWWQDSGKGDVWGFPEQKFEGFDRVVYTPNSEQGKLRCWKPLRIRLLDIRREPLCSISLDDARAEGCPIEQTKAPVLWYARLWESINGAGSWEANPDVWALTFEIAK